MTRKSITTLPNPQILRDHDAGRAFSGGQLQRLSENRSETSLTEAINNAESRVYLFEDDRALIKFENGAALPNFDWHSAQSLGLVIESMILLGYGHDGPRLAGLVNSDIARSDEIKAIDLRSLALQGLLDRHDLGAIAQGRSTLSWHAAHQFCANCGARTAVQAGGVRRYCKSCDTQHFPRVDPVVIMVAIDGDNCLLGRSPRFQPGMYSALAGFMEPGETIEEAVRRETFEESGIRLGEVAYFASQPWPFVSSLMIGCHAQALSREIVADETELEDCRWFSRTEVGSMLAGEHPEGLRAPPQMAIANRLVRAFAEG